MTTQHAADLAALAHPPMILPAGGYELEDIEKAGAAMMKAKPDDRERVMAVEIGKVRQALYEDSTAGALPGHEFVETERVLVPGVEQPVAGGKKGETEMVGEIRVTERIQVFNEEKAAEEVAASEEATSAAPAQPASGPATLND